MAVVAAETHRHGRADHHPVKGNIPRNRTRMDRDHLVAVRIPANAPVSTWRALQLQSTLHLILEILQRFRRRGATRLSE